MAEREVFVRFGQQPPPILPRNRFEVRASKGEAQSVLVSPSHKTTHRTHRLAFFAQLNSCCYVLPLKLHQEISMWKCGFTF